MLEIQEQLPSEEETAGFVPPICTHVTQRLCFVAEIAGLPVAVLLLQPAAAAQQQRRRHIGEGPQPGSLVPDAAACELVIQLAALFPEMASEQCAGVFAALASYTLHQLLAEGRAAVIRQGNLLLQQSHSKTDSRLSGSSTWGRAGADAPLLRVAAAPYEDASAELKAPDTPPLLEEHTIQFAPGHSFDSLAFAVAVRMRDLDAAEPAAHAAVRVRNGAALPPIQSPTATAPLGAAPNTTLNSASATTSLNPSIIAVVNGARRLSSMFLQPAELSSSGSSNAATAAAAAVAAAAAEELLADVTAVVEGFMEAAGFASEFVCLRFAAVMERHEFQPRF